MCNYSNKRRKKCNGCQQINKDLLEHRTDSFVERLFRSKFLLYCTEVRVTFHCDGYFLFRRTEPGVTILDVTCNVTQKDVTKTSLYIHRKLHFT